MLKFEFNLTKKEIFLSFWKIKSVDEFEKLAESSELFFFRFSHLNPQGFTALFHMIDTGIKQEKITIKDGFLKFQDSEKFFYETSDELDENILELLDSLNLINWLKDHTTLFKRNDKYELTPPFKKWLTSIPLSGSFFSKDSNLTTSTSGLPSSFLPHFEPSDTSSKESGRTDDFKILPKINFKGKINAKEKEILEDIFIHYLWTPEMILKQVDEEKTLLELKEKKLITFSLTSKNFSLDPVITINLESIQLEKQEKTPRNYPLEQVAFTLFYLDLKIYEFQTGKSMESYYPWKNSVKTKLLDQIFQYLIKSKKIRTYRNNDCYAKLAFLLKIRGIKRVKNEKNFAPNHNDLKHQKSLKTLFAFCEMISKINFFPNLSIQELAFLINQNNMIPVPISLPQLRRKLQILSCFGLVILKKDELEFDINSLRRITLPPQLNSETPKKDPELVLDSDMSLTGFKAQLNSEIVYHLLSFCKMEISEHLVKAEFSSAKSALAWFLGYTEQKILEFFKRHASNMEETELKNYLHFYFENNHEFREEKFTKLSTPSKSYFYKLKYLIKELTLEENITIIESKKTFLFHDKKTYQFLKEKLKDQKMEFIASLSGLQ